MVRNRDRDRGSKGRIRSEIGLGINGHVVRVRGPWSVVCCPWSVVRGPCPWSVVRGPWSVSVVRVRGRFVNGHLVLRTSQTISQCCRVEYQP